MMEREQYITHGTCSQVIDIEYDSATLTLGKINFIGGCNGNLKGICALAEGQNIFTIISRLEGIKCGHKSTSCPDQLARALRAIVARNGSANTGH